MPPQVCDKHVTPVRTISANWHVCFERITTVEMSGHVTMLSDRLTADTTSYSLISLFFFNYS